jgi:hypothetical protein
LYVILDFINFNCEVAGKTEKPGTEWIHERATGCWDAILFTY